MSKKADISFVGSGIATAYTLITLLDELKDIDSPTPLKISIIDKFGDFFRGIPYGSRSGNSVLLINSLRSFLPPDERFIFIAWLEENKNKLIETFLESGDKQSKKWLTNNKNDIEKGLWEELFVPRFFFGEYIVEKVNNTIKLAEQSGLVEINYIKSEVNDIIKEKNQFILKLRDNNHLTSKKIILSLGSLPTRNILAENNVLETPGFLVVNDIYDKDVDSNFEKIESFILNRKEKETNVLIIGANASALETIYKINDKDEINNSISKYFVLSTHGVMPDSKFNSELLKQFSPKNIEKLKTKDSITAKEIADATFLDLDSADEINLGAATTVDFISIAFRSLLGKLSLKEKEIFACEYGNKIGKRQRCAGSHYTGVVDKLVEEKKIDHRAGRFLNIIKDNDSRYNVNYTDSFTKQESSFPNNIHLIINCIGSINLETKGVPTLIQNLIEKNYCVPNNSKIGFKVNENFEATEDLFIAGPLLAGNVINSLPIWHLEHCGRIIWTSRLLGNSLIKKLSLENRYLKN